MAEIPAVPYGTWEILKQGGGVAFLAVGTMVLPAFEAARSLARDGIETTVVNCRFLKPYDRAMLEELVRGHEAFVVVEEGTAINGFGSFMAREISSLAGGRNVRVETLGLPDHFLEHGPRKGLLEDVGLTAEGIGAVGRGLAERVGLRGSARETA
jgi:1-deoxy-D-xylulose-5-phosphate synthase